MSLTAVPVSTIDEISWGVFGGNGELILERLMHQRRSYVLIHRFPVAGAYREIWVEFHMESGCDLPQEIIRRTAVKMKNYKGTIASCLKLFLNIDVEV